MITRTQLENEMEKYGVKYSSWGRADRLVNREKWFATKEARAAFLERETKKGNVYMITGYAENIVMEVEGSPRQMEVLQRAKMYFSGMKVELMNVTSMDETTEKLLVVSTPGGQKIAHWQLDEKGRGVSFEHSLDAFEL